MFIKYFMIYGICSCSGDAVGLVEIDGIFINSWFVCL